MIFFNKESRNAYQTKKKSSTDDVGQNGCVDLEDRHHKKKKYISTEIMWVKEEKWRQVQYLVFLSLPIQIWTYQRMIAPH